MSKLSFKSLVKKKVTQYFLLKLEGRKNKNSKSKFLKCEELKMADYIKNPALTNREKQLLFKLRSRTLDVKQNFPGQYLNSCCTSCGLFEESQGHLLQCTAIVSKLQHPNLNFSEEVGVSRIGIIRNRIRIKIFCHLFLALKI